ncbi:MAG: thioredoxin-disulfide reductase [Dehalococcoidia bacterium CG2_30_46_19]|nr:MAG: thioredoxin-disulfide reductase [Dehalococcoidia bacterium CG2_30_46_19]
MARKYQLIIVGGGPAGLTAGLYSARGGFKVLLIEKEVIGGQIANADRVDNYPGFPEGISGFELARLIHQQATNHGLETMSGEVTGLTSRYGSNIVNTTEGDFIAQAVIIAGGSQFRKLEVPGEGEFLGKGVSYCATCDGPLFRDKAVAVVGGGDTAVTDALSLSKFVSSVKVIHRRNQLRASKVLQRKAQTEPKIEFIWDSVVTEVKGKEKLTDLVLKNTKNGIISLLAVDGVFVAIGLVPNTEYLRGVLPLDEGGYIITTELMETTVPGIFAAGDIRHNSVKQAIVAAGNGAVAALSAEWFIDSL